MRVRRKTIIGKINSSGELQAPFDVLRDFCSMHKDRGVIIRAEIQSKEPSEKLRDYVFGYIIPEMQQAFHDNGEDYTKEGTFNRLRDLCPLFLEETYGESGWKRRIKDWSELDSAEAVEFIAWVQRLASIEYSIILNDPE